ncbi:MAG: hypothetical protein ACRD0W_18490, partial [Acidimicrobiales bacterium]
RLRGALRPLPEVLRVGVPAARPPARARFRNAAARSVPSGSHPSPPAKDPEGSDGRLAGDVEVGSDVGPAPGDKEVGSDEEVRDTIRGLDDTLFSSSSPTSRTSSSDPTDPDRPSDPDRSD